MKWFSGTDDAIQFASARGTKDGRKCRADVSVYANSLKQLK